MALADTMVRAGGFSASEWADALGQALRGADERGDPDTLDTYYSAVLAALEQLCEEHAGISAPDRERRRADWEAAYRRTPHGRPIEL